MLAQFAAQAGAPPIPVLRHQIPDQANFLSRDFTPLDEHFQYYNQRRRGAGSGNPAQNPIFHFFCKMVFDILEEGGQQPLYSAIVVLFESYLSTDKQYLSADDLDGI